MFWNPNIVDKKVRDLPTTTKHDFYNFINMLADEEQSTTVDILSPPVITSATSLGDTCELHTSPVEKIQHLCSEQRTLPALPSDLSTPLTTNNGNYNYVPDTWRTQLTGNAISTNNSMKSSDGVYMKK